MRKRFFTLIEIIAVIAIIAILAGLTVGVSTLVMRKAADTKTTAAIKYVEMALEKFKKDHGYYPQTGGTAVLMFETDPANTLSKCFDEKFRSANTRSITISGTEYLYVIDGYGNPMIYRCPGYFNRGKYDFGSAGKDKKIGDGHDKEITEGIIETTAEKKGGLEINDYTTHFGQGDDVVNFTVKPQ